MNSLCFTCSFECTVERNIASANVATRDKCNSSTSSKQNYWSARQGKSPLRRLEQLFALLLETHANIYEVVSIYTRLRNDQYLTLALLVQDGNLGAQVVYFLRLLIDRLILESPKNQDAILAAVKLCANVESQTTGRKTLILA